MTLTAIIIVKGKVQGVSYRETTRVKARALGITGTVENLPSGDVRIFATGSGEQIDELITWCHKGPLLARVSEVITELTDVIQYEGFVVKR
jgi:acylphosphatase